MTKNHDTKKLGKSGLTKKQQDDLLELIQAGNMDGASKNNLKKVKKATELLSTRCQPLIESIVSKYIQSTIPLARLKSLGNKGLEKAISRWSWKSKQKRKYKFTAYAAWFIQAEIHKELGLPTNPENFQKP